MPWADGSGLAALGAPPFNDTEWLYGGSLGDIRVSIALGRNGRMPAFAERLDETQIRLLTAWLVAGASRCAGNSAHSREAQARDPDVVMTPTAKQRGVLHGIISGAAIVLMIIVAIGAAVTKMF